MTDQKYGLLAAVQALRHAMMREGLETDGLAIVLPNAAFEHSERLLMKDFGPYFVAHQPIAQRGVTLRGVRILAASDVAIRD